MIDNLIATLNKTSASIVVHQTEPELLKTVVTSLRNDGVNVIMVIENSPAPFLELMCNELGLYYRHVENKGYGAGHNIAIKHALKLGMSYHLVVNPDVSWEKGVMPYLTDFFDKNPKAAQLMPLTRYPDGRLQHTCRLLPTPWDLICKRFLPARFTQKRMERYLLKPECYSKIINSPYLLGSFMYFRLEALKMEGFFDERFFMYPEDIDITRRLHRKWLTLMLPDVEIKHHHAAASRHNMKMLWIHISNMVKYFNKWGWFFDSERGAMNRKLLSELYPD